MQLGSLARQWLRPRERLADLVEVLEFMVDTMVAGMIRIAVRGERELVTRWPGLSGLAASAPSAREGTAVTQTF